MKTTPPIVVITPPAAVPVARVIASPPIFETSTMGVAFRTASTKRLENRPMTQSTGGRGDSPSMRAENWLCDGPIAEVACARTMAAGPRTRRSASQ